MVARGELELEVDLESDTAPVHELAAALLALGAGAALDARPDARRPRDRAQRARAGRRASRVVARRGGAAACAPAVVGACEILGIDPLYVANEGKLVAVVAAEAADAALALLRAHPLGADAAIVGEVRAEPEGLVLLDTALGGSRIVDMLVGDPLPRIC